MRWMIALATFAAAIPANAQNVAIESAIYLERVNDGETQLALATRLTRGDRVVTILTWDVPPDRGSYTVTSPVPTRLALQSTSRPDVDVSTDGGRTWRRLADPDTVPHDTTHLRWRVGGDGRLSYRAVVR
jgi:hypothetical protein